MKRKLFWSLMLALLGLGMLFTSIALAAPNQPSSPAAKASFWLQEVVTPTNTVTPTVTPTGTSSISPTTTVSPTAETTGTHPVATAMADHFEVTYAEIADLHTSGLGFGVIARAYFMAEQLEGVTPEDLLLEFQSGLGWGQIARLHELHPGRRGFGGSVGDIMSGKGPGKNKFKNVGKGNKHWPGQGDTGNNEGNEVEDAGRGNGKIKQKNNGNNGNGNGKNNGQGNGNGNNGNGKGKGKGKGKK